MNEIRFSHPTAPLRNQPLLCHRPLPELGLWEQGLNSPLGRPESLLSTGPWPSNPAASRSLTGLQAELAAQVTGSNPAADAAGHTGLVAGTVADAASTTSRVASQTGRLARSARVAGPIGGVIASGAQVVESGLEIRQAQRDPNLSEAQKEQKAGRAAVVGGSKLLGGMGGLAAGAAAGFAIAGPVGAIVLGVAGGFGGDWAAGKVGEALGDTGLGRAVGKLFA